MEKFPLAECRNQDILQAVALCRTLQKAGYPAYFAGGAVRDLLFNRPVHDVDIATAAKPETVLRLFPQSHYHGKAFGVVEVIQGSGRYQIATFRKESNYQDFRHPETVEFTDAETDANRRDFTINALFLDPVSEHILDFVDGLKDIKTLTLRTVGKANERFHEDALRLLRGVRFLHTLPVSPADDLIPSIKSNAELIRHISRERIYQEVNRLFTETENLHDAVSSLLETNLLEKIDESFFFTHVQQPLLKKRFPANAASNPLLPWCLLCLPEKEQDSAHPAQSFLKTLTCPNEIIDCAGFIQEKRARLASDKSLSRLEQMRWRDHPHVQILLDFLSMDSGSLTTEEIREWSEHIHRLPPTPEALITGKDLLNAGIEPSPRLGKWLTRAHEAQVDGVFNTKQEGLEWVMQNLH